MIIVDASVLANAFTDDGPLGVCARAELDRDPYWAAPEHLVVEAFSAIRGRYLGGHLSEARARQAVEAVAAAAIELISTAALLDRMWQLRHNISGYDAAYVAAAEVNASPLVSVDRRLRGAPGLHCEVRLALPAE